MPTGRPTTAARRYAEALFEIAAASGQHDAFDAGLDHAVARLAPAEPGGGPDPLAMLRNPAIPLRQRLDLLRRLIADRAPEPVLRAAGLLVERGRIDRLPAVAAEYRRLLNGERGVVEALATTAAPLTRDETDALRTKVAGMTGKTVDLRVEVDESLIGGLTVRVGDTLFDASVRGRLERLRARLVSSAR